MKRNFLKGLIPVIAIIFSGNMNAFSQNLKVTIDQPINGTISLDPQLPADGTYP